MAWLNNLYNWGRNVLRTTQTIATAPVFGENGLIGTGGRMVDTTPPELKPVINPSARETATQRLIVEARAYHDGLIANRLTDTLRDALGMSKTLTRTNDSGEEERISVPSDVDDFVMSLNFVARINKARAERLKPLRFICETDSQAEKEKQEEWANEVVWDTSRLKGKRALLFLQAIRDGQAYFVIDPDSSSNRARITPHVHYTDEKLGGTCDDDGEGVQMFYPNDDTDQRPLFAAKRWTEHELQGDGTTEAVKRITLYGDNVIRRWEKRNVNSIVSWRLLEQGGTAPWTNAAGEPLGLPVVHLKTPALKPAARPAYGAQRALNRLFTSMLEGAEIDLLKIIVTYGWQPSQSECRPGMVMGTNNADGSHGVIEGSDPTRYVTIIDKQIALMSDLTNTPLSLIQRSAQRAAEGTLQEEKESFFSEIDDIAETFAMAIEDALRKARTIHNTFFAGGDPLDETLPLRVEWKPFGGNKTTAEKQADADLVLAMQQAAQGFIDAGAPAKAAYLAAGFDADMAEQLSVTWLG